MSGVPAPREVAKGTGWRVHRLGKSFCITIKRTDDPGVAEVWINRPPNDITRGALLGAFLAGVHGTVDRNTAIEAMGADW